ncbi:MAG: ACT domain-containing protein [Ruminococcaceae bacterium]|nr:ACT domain-containing protein [Oscillospiraceae bacterium]
MQAVISVTGKDSVGIIAKVSQKCFENNVNIIDISQSVLKDYFAMIMLVEIDAMKVAFTDFVDMMNNIGKENNLSIHTMHEDIFNSMHKI